MEDGYDLRCLVRSESSQEARSLKSSGAELAVGNILDADSLARGVTGCNAVIHLVGIILERRGASFEQVHVGGTRNLLYATKQAGIKRFLHMSALGTGPGAAAAYHQTKWQAEEDVRASGLDYTIFRPSIIHGPDGEFINMLARQVRLSPVVPVIGNGRYRMQPVSVFDVAASFSNSLEKRDTFGKVYEIGGPEALGYNEMIDALCQVMGKRRLKAHIPVALVRPVAWLSEKIMPRPLLTNDQLNMLLGDNVCDIKAMREELGVEPAPFSEALPAALHRFFYC